MSIVIQFVPSAEALFPPAEEKSLFANQESGPIRLSPVCEPEQRLWKLSTRAVSSRFIMVELFVLVLFLSVALVGIVSCFAELSHLLGSDSIGHVAMRAISGRL